MNDEIINGIMQRGLFVKHLGGLSAEIREALAKHDTAQREALARVEAERDEAREFMRINAKSGLHYAEQRDAAKAQLAEAVGLLLDASDPKGPCIRYAAIKDFLLRYASMPDMTAEQSAVISHKTRDTYVAQAEQQEAQGAQAGQPVAEVVSGYSGDPDTRGSRMLKVIGDLPEVGVKLYAALATQTAALPTDPADWPLKVGADEFVRQQAEWPDTDTSDFMHDALYEMIRVLTKSAVRGAEQ